MKTNRLSTQDLCMIGVWTAIIIVLSQIAIPMPLGVPMTMQTFAITLVAIVLGKRKGAIATLIYVLLGTIGLPVFTGFKGGVGSLVSPTGGFILSFPIMAYIIGWGIEQYRKNKMLFLGALSVGTIINFGIGALVFCMITGSSLLAAMTACVLPFIPTAIIKAVAASMLGMRLRVRVIKL